MVSVFLVNRVDVWVVYQRWHSELGTWIGVWEKPEVKRGENEGKHHYSRSWLLFLLLGLAGKQSGVTRAFLLGSSN